MRVGVFSHSPLFTCAQAFFYNHSCTRLFVSLFFSDQHPRPPRVDYLSSATAALLLLLFDVKSPFLNGTPVRYAVSAGWLKGVCFDVSNNTFNLAVRVPVQRREDPPEGARPYPPGSHPHPRCEELSPRVVFCLVSGCRTCVSLRRVRRPSCWLGVSRAFDLAPSFPEPLFLPTYLVPTWYHTSHNNFGCRL